MKRFFLAVMMAAMFMFASCEYTGNSTKDAASTDSVVVINDSILQKDTIILNVDTIHCIATTKTGEQCKNHSVTGDSLCAIHRRLNK